MTSKLYSANRIIGGWVVTNDDGVAALEAPKRFECMSINDAAWLVWALNEIVGPALSRAAFDKGYQAALRGETRRELPYVSTQWQEGWDAATIDEWASNGDC